MKINSRKCTVAWVAKSVRLACALATVAAFSIPPAQAQDYPAKPIRIVVPLPPGGSNDVLARLLGQKMSEAFGQPVLVENKPGAAGNIATDYMAKSEGDGYTIAIAQPDGRRQPRAVPQAAV